MKKKHDDIPAEIVSEKPKVHDRMVRVKNVCTRDINEAGKVYHPGEEFDLTPERAADYKQRVRIVHK